MSAEFDPEVLRQEFEEDTSRFRHDRSSLNQYGASKRVKMNLHEVAIPVIYPQTDTSGCQ